MTFRTLKRGVLGWFCQHLVTKHHQEKIARTVGPVSVLVQVSSYDEVKSPLEKDPAKLHINSTEEWCVLEKILTVQDP